jgi:hypothetical protein
VAYSWAIYAVSFLALVPVYLVPSFVVPSFVVPSFVVVAFEDSGHYAEAAAITVIAVLVVVYVMALPGLGGIRTVEQWVAGREGDRAWRRLGAGSGRSPRSSTVVGVRSWQRCASSATSYSCATRSRTVSTRTEGEHGAPARGEYPYPGHAAAAVR